MATSPKRSRRENSVQLWAELKLPTGYEITWGGQFENFERAKRRLALIVPLALVIIFAMLVAMFQEMRAALGVFAVVPFALIGGIVGLSLRGLSFSIPAAVGFIALAGCRRRGTTAARHRRHQRHRPFHAAHDVSSSGAPAHRVAPAATIGRIQALPSVRGRRGLVGSRGLGGPQPLKRPPQPSVAVDYPAAPV